MKHLLSIACVGMLAAAIVSAKEKQPATYSIPLPSPPDYSALDWLVGEWAGKTTGRGSPGEIRLSVAYELDRQIMVFREEISLPATKQAPAVSESWMGILTADRSSPAFVLRTFSSTGFQTLYRVTVEGSEIRFNPEGGDLPPPGWLFRRVIQRASDTEFVQTVQAAPPGKPFFDYYTAKFTRIPPPPTPAADSSSQERKP